jgi:putative transposase
MDWFSRKVLSWRVSNSMAASFCIEALTEALSKYGKPEIFNMDQGPQYTCNAFLSILKANEIQISMAGRGRALDNIFVERLWRNVKYEKIYLNEYSSVPALKSGLEDYFKFYNQERPHQSLDYQTPDEVYESKSMESGSRVPRLLLPSLEFIHGTGKPEKKTLQECVVILSDGGRVPTISMENHV